MWELLWLCSVLTLILVGVGMLVLHEADGE